MTTNTVRLHRVLRAKPDKLYRAFLDAEAVARAAPNDAAAHDQLADLIGKFHGVLKPRLRQHDGEFDRRHRARRSAEAAAKGDCPGANDVHRHCTAA